MLVTIAARVSFSTLALLVLVSSVALCDEAAPEVRTLRVPDGGLQPRVVAGTDGVIHMIFYDGSPRNGDVYYVSSRDDGKTFRPRIRVNSQEGSAIAVGNIRGAQISLGRDDRVHVAWNGSGKALPRGLPNPDIAEGSPYRLSSPMLYARLADKGNAFEPQRNLMHKTYALDGGGSVAADTKGNVYVVWHGSGVDGPKGEGGRAVWVAKSTDDGKTFAEETRLNRDPTGACGCCGLTVFADRDGVPAWSLVAAFARKDGGFTVVY
jgi:hypothetical protein